jgi:hypothetical protein
VPQLFSTIIFVNKVLDRSKGSNDQQFGGGLTKLDLSSEQYVLNPTITVPHLLWLSTIVAWITLSRRFIFVGESKNPSKNMKQSNQIIDE